MKTKILFIAAVFAISFNSCQNEKKEKVEETKKEETQTIKDEDLYESKMAETENNPDLKVINSLAYNNNEGSRIEAVAFLDANDNEVKIQETFADNKSGDYGTKTFYIENGKKYATKEVYFDNQLKTPSFVERVSFYNKAEKVIFTKERIAEFEDELEDMAFQVRSSKDCSIERTMNVLNQEKEFETTFQGFASAGNMEYLLVGENSKDGYASSLAIQYKEGDIVKLLNNEKTFIGTPLEVEHQVMVDERGLKFQILLSVKIK